MTCIIIYYLFTYNVESLRCVRKILFSKLTTHFSFLVHIWKRLYRLWNKSNNSKSWPMFGCTSRLLGRCYLILIGVDLEIFVYITSHCSYISFLKTGIHLPFNRFINLSHDIFWKEKNRWKLVNFMGSTASLYLVRGYVMLLDKPSLIHSQCMPLLALRTFPFTQFEWWQCKDHLQSVLHDHVTWQLSTDIFWPSIMLWSLFLFFFVLLNFFAYLNSPSIDLILSSVI